MDRRQSGKKKDGGFAVTPQAHVIPPGTKIFARKPALLAAAMAAASMPPMPTPTRAAAPVPGKPREKQSKDWTGRTRFKCSCGLKRTFDTRDLAESFATEHTLYRTHHKFKVFPT
jgi:hypothetical protein